VAFILTTKHSGLSALEVNTNNSSTDTPSASERVVEQAKKDLLQYALFRPESAIVLALGIIGAGLRAINVPWMPGEWWMWLAGGGLGFGGIVLSTLKDPKFFQSVVSKTFVEQYDYRELIVKEIQRQDNPVLDEHLMDAARRTEDWISQVYRLAQTLDLFENDKVVMRDMVYAPKELAQLQAQLRTALGSGVQMELARTIELKQKQINSLQNLRDTMQRARLQLANTLSAMGTMYMQVKVLSSRDVNSQRTSRLQTDMMEQVQSLEDTRAEMDELYRSGFNKN
jgi:hypothetical protein